MTQLIDTIERFRRSFLHLLDRVEKLDACLQTEAFRKDCQKILASAKELRRVGEAWSSQGLNPESLAEKRRYEHDIRTPVNHLIGYSELIREDGEDDLTLAEVRALDDIIAAAREFLSVLENRDEGDLAVALQTELSSNSKPEPVSAAEFGQEVEPGRIMVVDDDSQNREIVVRKLTPLGHTMIEARGGEEALTLATQRSLDLILLDMVMPGLDGLATARRFKQIDGARDTPIIFMTGSNREETLPQAFRAGVVDYLSKPIRHDEMLARVSTHLRIIRLARSLEAKNLELEAEINRRTEAERKLDLASKEAEQRFCAGGTLRFDSPSYVERDADRQLLRHLSRRTLTYVFTSRQMGKSSLMARTAATVRADGGRVATLDLTAIGQNLNAEQWYDGLVSRLGWQLNLEDEIEDFWLEHKRLSPVQRFFSTLRSVILPRHNSPLVLFVDEIDAVRSLPFSSDEFFSAIRETMNRRAEDPEFEKLTFCILGVAAPSSLLRDSRLTPFDLGARVLLGDFREVEMRHLGLGLSREKRIAEELISRVYYWTSGHPYLTQRLCKLLLENPEINSTAALDELGARHFFKAGSREEDDNLVFVRQSLLASTKRLRDRLELYRCVRSGEEVLVKSDDQLLHELEMTGVIRLADGRAVVRNRIYERVFGLEWTDRILCDL